MGSQQIQIDLLSLPEQAQLELMDFYEFLTQKYLQKSEQRKVSLTQNDILQSKSLVRGRLKSYCNPEQREMEKELGWEWAMKEKHAKSRC